MRIFSALAIALVMTGCSAGAQQPQAEEGAERIDCALDGADDFAAECLVERGTVEDTRVLTVRHPDGGFRRFEQVDDGRGLTIYDGADEAVGTLDGDMLAVTVAADRYRFPAASKDSGADE